MKRLWILLAIAAVLLVISQLPLIYCYVEKPGLNSVPQRIVSLSPNLTEVIFALGLGDKVVGVSNDSDWPAEAKNKPEMGTFWQPNTEAIIAAKPDLVVCETFLQHKEIAETLKRSGINVLSLRIESIQELYAAIEHIGKATGSNDKAQELVSKIQNEIEQIKAAVSTVNKVKVLWAVQTEPIRVVGVKTFVNEIIDIAGGQNVIAPTGDQYPSVGAEAIMTCGAEVIIQSAMGTQDIKKQQESAVKFWSKFVNIPAVKNNKIYVINSDTVLHLGPRISRGAQMVAECLHPELFTQVKEPNTQK